VMIDSVPPVDLLRRRYRSSRSSRMGRARDLTLAQTDLREESMRES
jgi:hypothetical protein